MVALDTKPRNKNKLEKSSEKGIFMGVAGVSNDFIFPTFSLTLEYRWINGPNLLSTFQLMLEYAKSRTMEDPQ